jgi:hypothetical protein
MGGFLLSDSISGEGIRYAGKPEIQIWQNLHVKQVLKVYS